MGSHLHESIHHEKRQTIEGDALEDAHHQNVPLKWRKSKEEGRHKDAERYLRQALERVPDHKECQAYIAVCLAGKRKFVSAEKLAKNVIRNNPFDAVAYYARQMSTVGVGGAGAPPPSEPDVRFSRIRLSGQ